jgi:hypothetical protein
MVKMRREILFAMVVLLLPLLTAQSVSNIQAQSEEGGGSSAFDDNGNGGNGDDDEGSGDGDESNDESGDESETQPEPEPIEPEPEPEPPVTEEQLPRICIPEDLDCDGDIDPPFIGPPIPEPPEPEPDPTPPDERCLFDPTLPHCEVNEDLPGNECPEGFNRNDDDQCYPEHDQCPEGYHSHEDDESGKCIPDDVPCEPGFIRDPDLPTCSDKERVCREHPNADVCKPNEDDDNKEISSEGCPDDYGYYKGGPYKCFPIEDGELQTVPPKGLAVCTALGCPWNSPDVDPSKLD